MSKKISEKNDEFSSLINTYEWIQSLASALVVCVILFLFIFRLIDVKGTSMNPTLFEGDKMLVSPILYEPNNGDIIVFKKDEYDPNKALVKRVIATEGQEINIDFDKGIVYVDGQIINEDYIADITTTKLDFIGPKTVPENCIFVLGDNRNMSTDSRKSEIGMVDKRLVLGKVYMVLYPPSDFGAVH